METVWIGRISMLEGALQIGRPKGAEFTYIRYPFANASHVQPFIQKPYAIVGAQSVFRSKGHILRVADGGVVRLDERH